MTSPDLISNKQLAPKSVPDSKVLSWESNLFIGVWINKLQPIGSVASAGQMGQHSPDGMTGLAHSLISSQIISSHRTAPLSHTQMRHGSGFHTSLSLYCWASCVQPPASSVVASRGEDVRGGTAVKRYAQRRKEVHSGDEFVEQIMLD